MLKRYRERFVLFNVLMVGVVLLASLVVQGVHQYRMNRAELENTMKLLVEPWDSESDLSRENSVPPKPPEGKKESDLPAESTTSGENGENVVENEVNGGDNKSEKSQKISKSGDKETTSAKKPPEGRAPRKRSGEDKEIVTAFYDAEADETSILSRDPFLDEETVLLAAREIAARDASFGVLEDEALIYYKEKTGGVYKIALADTAYLGSRTLKNALVLLGAYLASMALVVWISIELSKRAAKPMEEAVEMERRFIADISHDLKTPITVVLANNSILKSNPDASPEERAQWIESTNAAAKNMMTMVGQMLTLSSLEEVGAQKVERTPVDLSSAAEKAALQLESLAYERGVAIETDLLGGVIVSATEEYAERICGGLIENAIKYEPDGGRVRVTLTREKRRAVLRVQNFGSVISPEEQSRVFERFYRGDKARTQKSGHGLGLPIIKRVCDLLGAEIAVTSDAQSGTVFTVAFECAE